MSRLTGLVRPKIASLKPYSAARDEFAIDDHSAHPVVLLDANENSLGGVLDVSADGPQGRFHGLCTGLNRYPDPYQRRLKALIAAHWNSDLATAALTADQIFLGTGSDEAIDLLFKLFCEPNRDAVLSVAPTYGMYRVSADINSVRYDEVALSEDFELDEAAILAAVRPETKLLFLCSPNNPTGKLIGRAQVERLLAAFPGYVVVDEAYIEFAPGHSACPLLAEHENLIILRTFSKAWGLAGIRLGAAVARAELVTLLNKIKAPYNISQLTQRAATIALAEAGKMRQFVATLVGERTRLSSALAELSVVEQVVASDANFLLVRFTDSAAAFAVLRAAGIIVRDRSTVPGCRNCLRITVGTAAQNAALCAVLAELARTSSCVDKPLEDNA